MNIAALFLVAAVPDLLQIFPHLPLLLGQVVDPLMAYSRGLGMLVGTLYMGALGGWGVGSWQLAHGNYSAAKGAVLAGTMSGAAAPGCQAIFTAAGMPVTIPWTPL